MAPWARQPNLFGGAVWPQARALGPGRAATYARNRTHSVKQDYQIAASLKLFEFMSSVVDASNDGIITQHERLAVAIPVLFAQLLLRM